MGSGGKEKEPKQKKKPGRVPTSCAECRRLKLRCDRNVPCEKCVSRGCGSICPNGVLTPGKNNRMILANTEELHDRIDLIMARNRELENALQVLQDSISDQPHPLLLEKDRLNLTINVQQGSSSGPSTSSSSKSPSTSRISPAVQSVDATESKPEEDNHLVEAIGTLTVGRRGQFRYLGKTARSEFLAQVASRPFRKLGQSSRLSKRLLDATLPDSILQDDNLLSEILHLLPPHSEAVHLCDLYLEYGKFFYFPITRKELFDEILTGVYRARRYNGFDHYHILSLLFIVFAIAELFNLKKQPYPPEARDYYHLSRVALQFHPPTNDSTLEAIQSLVHMAQYLDLEESDSSSSEMAWTHIGYAMRLAQSIGLHMNSARWRLGEEILKRRQDLFWGLFVSDFWISSNLGRPPGISRAQIDVLLPPEPSAADPADLFHSWNVHFTLFLSSITETALFPKPPGYSRLLDIDHKIREFEILGQWRISKDPETWPTANTAMYRWLALSAKEIALINLHRGYFAQALQEAPADLQRHRYLPSVVSTYRSAWRLIHGLITTWAAIPRFLARVSIAWSHGLSSAILMCLLVTRAPTSHFTSAALDDLDSLASLFDSATSSCQSASKLLTSIHTLRRKAHEATSPTPARPYTYLEDGTRTITLSELDRMNGKTALLSETRSSTSTSAPLASNIHPSSSVPSSNELPHSRATSVTISDFAEGSHIYTSPTSLFHNVDNLNPTLVRDLREFSMGRVAKMDFFDSTDDDGSGDVDMAMSMSPPPSTFLLTTRPGEPSLPVSHIRLGHPHPRLQTHHMNDSRPPTPPAPPSEVPSPLMASHTQYYQTSLQQANFFSEARRSTFPTTQTGPSGSNLAANGFGVGNACPPGFQSGWGSGGWSNGFGHAPFILDSSWTSFVEQLGF